MDNIKDYNLEELKSKFIELGEKPYRAEQVFKWLYVDEVSSFDEMTNLSKDLREKFSGNIDEYIFELQEELRKTREGM